MKRGQRWPRLLTLMSMMALPSVPTLAFTPGACRQDAEKLCPGVADKEAAACLRQHQDALSTACKVNLAEAREHVRQAKEACADDTKKFCADVKPGGGRIVRCLKAHDAELAEPCRAKLTETKRKFQGEPPPAVK